MEQQDIFKVIKSKNLQLRLLYPARISFKGEIESFTDKQKLREFRTTKLALWASLIAQLVKNLQCRKPQFSSWVGKIPGLGEGTGYPLQYSWASLVAHLVKNPPTMQETWVRSLGWEDPLEKRMATYSSILA